MPHHRAENATITDLIQQLQHPTWRMRRDAVVALGLTKRVEAIPPLLDALGDFDRQDEDSKVNMCAGNALCEIGELRFSRSLTPCKSKPIIPTTSGVAIGSQTA